MLNSNSNPFIAQTPFKLAIKLTNPSRVSPLTRGDRASVPTDPSGIGMLVTFRVGVRGGTTE